MRWSMPVACRRAAVTAKGAAAHVVIYIRADFDADASGTMDRSQRRRRLNFTADGTCGLACIARESFGCRPADEKKIRMAAGESLRSFAQMRWCAAKRFATDARVAPSLDSAFRLPSSALNVVCKTASNIPALRVANAESRVIACFQRVACFPPHASRARVR